MSSLTFIDLFAGIGGMRLGFERAGGECVFTSEWDKWAQETYRANFAGAIQADIRAIDAENVPDHDILLAGFPCQPFSLAGVSKNNALGREHGFEHETQGTLFFDVSRILAARRPQAFLLENVKNLASHDGGKTLRVILHVLQEELGYQVVHRVIDASPVVPQHRERIYIVGFREPRQFAFPRLELARKPLRELLEREVARKYTLTPALWEYLQQYASKHRRAGHGFGYGLLDPDDPNVVARTLSARYHKDGSEILISQPGDRPRRLTPRECARLMGFPDDYIIPVSDTRSYRQFGNSVVVPVIEALARAMTAALQGELPALGPSGHQGQLALLGTGRA